MEGFGNVLPVGTRVQTFRRKGPQTRSFFWSKMDPKSIDFDTFLRPQKRYLKMNNFGVHFGVHFLVRLSPQKVSTLHTCPHGKHFWYPHQKIRAPKNGPKNGPQFRYKNLLKTLVCLIKIYQNGSLFGPQTSKSIDFGTSKRCLK